VVPEREKPEPAGARPEAIEKPGAYVLQAGSYRNFADADRVRAQLALKGIESKIQRVSVDNDTWHRIRIGPIADLAELNRTRDKLRQANIDALVIRVGD
jgi:cell division protein FtsN